MNFNLISISLEGNLQECVDLMRTNKIHRIIVEDAKNANLTGFITYETIFEFFINNYYSDMSSFQFKIDESNIINKNLIFIYKNDTIYNSLVKFYIHKVSILPVLCPETNKIYAFFYLKDLIYFFAISDKFTVNFFLQILV